MLEYLSNRSPKDPGLCTTYHLLTIHALHFMPCISCHRHDFMPCTISLCRSIGDYFCLVLHDFITRGLQNFHSALFINSSKRTVILHPGETIMNFTQEALHILRHREGFPFRVVNGMVYSETAQSALRHPNPNHHKIGREVVAMVKSDISKSQPSNKTLIYRGRAVQSHTSEDPLDISYGEVAAVDGLASHSDLSIGATEKASRCRIQLPISISIPDSAPQFVEDERKKETFQSMSPQNVSPPLTEEENSNRMQDLVSRMKADASLGIDIEGDNYVGFSAEDYEKAKRIVFMMNAECNMHEMDDTSSDTSEVIWVKTEMSPKTGSSSVITISSSTDESTDSDVEYIATIRNADKARKSGFLKPIPDARVSTCTSTSSVVVGPITRRRRAMWSMVTSHGLMSRLCKT